MSRAGGRAKRHDRGLARGCWPDGGRSPGGTLTEGHPSGLGSGDQVTACRLTRCSSGKGGTDAEPASPGAAFLIRPAASVSRGWLPSMGVGGGAGQPTASAVTITLSMLT
jgi:hypothetical protein